MRRRAGSMDLGISSVSPGTFVELPQHLAAFWRKGSAGPAARSYRNTGVISAVALEARQPTSSQHPSAPPSTCRGPSPVSCERIDLDLDFAVGAASACFTHGCSALEGPRGRRILVGEGSLTSCAVATSANVKAAAKAARRHIVTGSLIAFSLSVASSATLVDDCGGARSAHKGGRRTACLRL